MGKHLLKIPKRFDDSHLTNNAAARLSPGEFPEQDFLLETLSLYHYMFLRENFFDCVAKKYQSKIPGFEKINLWGEKRLYLKKEYLQESHRDRVEHQWGSKHR